MKTLQAECAMRRSRRARCNPSPQEACVGKLHHQCCAPLGTAGTPLPDCAAITPTPPSLAGVSLAYSNSLAGRLCDWTVRQGMGPTGCFLGGAATTAVAIAALLLFAWLGELGREPPRRKSAFA